jgi:acetylornithine deacetylase
MSNARTVEILKTLVAFPTVSSDSNLALIAWVEQFLSQKNIPHWRVNEQLGKSSLIARIGPDTTGGIVLSGHTDVVPVKDQQWQSDPFTLTQRGDQFFGRGTSDMKSFIALALAHCDDFLALKLTKPIWLAFSHDEEIGCLGAAPMATALIEKNAAPSLVLIGEPTNMELVHAHKGILSFETIVTGKEAHSSMPEQGVNAVMVLVELINVLARIGEASRAKQTANDFITPYTSVHVGVVEGGVARNIIPARARMCWEVRPLPGEDVEALLKPFHEISATLQAQIKARHAVASITTRQLTNVRALQADKDAAHLALAHHLAQCNHSHAVAFGTEGGIFQGHGLPVVVCGPGSIDQAHQPDEFITVEQLNLGAAFMRRVGEACTGA